MLGRGDRFTVSTPSDSFDEPAQMPTERGHEQPGGTAEPPAGDERMRLKEMRNPLAQPQLRVLGWPYIEAVALEQCHAMAIACEQQRNRKAGHACAHDSH